MSFPTLVSTEWLAENLNNSNVRILDSTVFLSPPSGPGERWTVSSNREVHDALHIPGSYYADLISEFSAPIGRFPRPDSKLFASSLQRLAIGQDIHVVIYDRASGVWAARLFWVMRSYGLGASILDGGFALWQAEGRPTSSEITSLPTVPGFVLQDKPELFVDRKNVLEIVERGGASLLNALGPIDFHATETNSYARPGRIPGSFNIPASSLVDSTGLFLPISVLRERFSEVITRPGRKVAYCGGGIAACVDAMVLTLLGEQEVAVYDASYEEWAADPSLPVEVDAPES